MKSSFLIAILLFLLSCNQSSSDSPADTTAYTPPAFIPYDTIATGYLSYIYIDHNQNSELYNKLLDFSFNNPESINGDIEYFKKNLGITIKKHNITGLPTEWIPLIQYKGKYYSFIRHDYPRLGMLKITDSLLYRYDMLDGQPDVMESVEKLGPKKFRIKTSPKLLEEEITIYIIDEKNKIAVWETKDVKNNTVDYQLYIAEDQLKNFGIMADAGLVSCSFFKPDSTNFQKLIGNL